MNLNRKTSMISINLTYMQKPNRTLLELRGIYYFRDTTLAQKYAACQQSTIFTHVSCSLPKSQPSTLSSFPNSVQDREIQINLPMWH